MGFIIFKDDNKIFLIFKGKVYKTEMPWNSYSI